MKKFRSVLLIALVSTSPWAHAALLIGVLAAPRQGELALVGGGTFGNLIASQITTRFPGAQLVGTQTLTPAFLSAVDIVILNSASGFGIGTLLSPSEQTAVFNFVAGGKGAIIAADGNPSWAGNSFGVTTGQATSSQGSFTDFNHPVARGAFGTLTTFFLSTRSATPMRFSPSVRTLL